MDFLLFVLRTFFLILIYAFIFVIFIYLVRDLRQTGMEQIPRPVRQARVNGPKRAGEAEIGEGVGLIQVEAAPEDYEMTGMQFPLAEEVKMGRGNGNDIVLPGKYISNNHAIIYHKGGQYWIKDLGSRNGTFLNGLPLKEPAVLADNDQIKIGDITFRLVRWNYEVESDHRVWPGTPQE